MKITLLNLTSGNEVLELEAFNPGFYLANNSLWLKSKDNIVTFIWSSVSEYIDIDDIDEDSLDMYTPPGLSVDNSSEISSEIGEIQTITPDLLLKAIAVVADPTLAFRD